MILDFGLDCDGRIVLRLSDDGVRCETELVMSVGEARALVAHFEVVIAAAEALPAGRRINLEEGHA